MNEKIIDFYTGYEGEGEIQFIHSTQTDQKIILKIWDGFFDDIMEKIEPEVTGWTSLAYYYNLVKGWYEETPWEVPNIATALQQLSKVKGAEFRFSQTQNVLDEICSLLESAVQSNNHILIARE